MSFRSKNILLIDDDDTDNVWFKRHHSHYQLESELAIQTDARFAFYLIQGQILEQDFKQPDIIFLNWLISGFSAEEFIQAAHRKRIFDHSVLFILSESNQLQDILLAYKQPIAGFFNKDFIQSNSSEFFAWLKGYSYCISVPKENQYV